MSTLEYKKLSDAEVAEETGKLGGWSIEDGKLVKRFTFNTYKDGLVFALAVGQVADNLDHHPDIEVGFAKVKIAVNTHSVGGISPYDFELARRIEALQA